MMVKSPSADRAGGRFLGLDQARALAIIAMMVSHFGPGLFIHVSALEPLRTPLLWFGRAATPAFATVFGVTVGFVLLPRFVRGDRGETVRRLWRRAGLIFLCAIAITVPLWVQMERRGVTDAWQWVFGLYSVLLFYSLAFLSLPIWLRWLSRHTTARALAAGVMLWAAGTFGYELWPQQPPSGIEFLRLILVSGSYGYLHMMGTALLALPLGWQLRQSLDTGTGDRFLVRLLGVGISIAVLAAAWGRVVGEYDLGRVVAGELRAPARPWYFLHFGGLAVAAMVVLELLTRRVRVLHTPGYILALFGQTSLLLYTGHVFVLPMLEVLDRFIPLHGMMRAAVPLFLFVTFCAVVLYSRHSHLQEQKKAGRPVTPPREEPPSATRFRCSLAPFVVEERASGPLHLN
jgi:Acyltransferase family